MKKLMRANSLKRIIKRTPSFLAEHNLPVTIRDVYLHRMKDLHKNKIGFLIGNGKSVRLQDLEDIDSGVTFCCNRFHLIYDQTVFRPDYTVVSDPQVLNDFGQEIVDNCESEVFLASESIPKVHGSYRHIKLRYQRPVKCDRSLYEFAAPGGGVLLVALQIGMHMGISRFICYGVDHDFKYSEDAHSNMVTGGDNHFIPNYRSGKAWHPPDTGYIEETMLAYDRYLRARGGWLMNGSRGGKLSVLERCSIDEYLKI